MKHNIPVDRWDRASAFRHFIRYSDPYFGVCTELDVTAAYARAKDMRVSFFLYYFYLSLMAANGIPEFRTRLEKNTPVIYDAVHGSPTILRNDGGLGFALLEYRDSFGDFLKDAETEMTRVKAQTGLDASKDRPDTIYYSILPWIRFTSVSHPLDLPRSEGVPILSFGKLVESNGCRLIPVGVHAHHALMDGMHIGRFLEDLQARLNAPVV
ncbi:MAG: chloramphenicol acetyltransferase [Candidatus Marinimicrobia bacterium]|nr:chloramphenicol acetyltransferase [Candidatus Neomarinimicrobiota bacterium]